MATEDDSGGLVDRRSVREIVEAGVGGKNAPRSAKAQIANTRLARKLIDRDNKRIARMREGQSTDSSQ